jgi:type II secretory pathway pseudopilin PulG
MELLVVISITMVLVAMLLGGINILRRKAAEESARQTVRELETAIALYVERDLRKRFPPVAADLSLSNGPGGALVALESCQAWTKSDHELDPSGRLLDPWGEPYRYSLIRPAPTSGTTALARWNWDAAAGHERRWGTRWDAAANATVTGALPYAYVWSLGPESRGDDATRWIILGEGAN